MKINIINHAIQLFLNAGINSKFSVILERSENHRFEQAKDPTKNLWALVHSKLIKKPSANLYIWILHFVSLRSTLLKDDAGLKLYPLYKKCRII